MKRITITYCMGKPGEVAENCITVPMCDEMAGLLHDYDNGIENDETIDAYVTVEVLCQHLAALAGYDSATYVSSEMAARQYDEEE